MAYQDFTQRFNKVRNQYNIMALVGNGFDVQALSGLRVPTDTRYESFYYYLKYQNFDGNNLILKCMEDLRNRGQENWSDVENAIKKLLRVGGVRIDDIRNDLRLVQREFANFLDQVVTPDVLVQFGETVASHKLSILSLRSFLYDIQEPEEYFKMRLIKDLGLFDCFNFKFINFNYTTLLDNFVYLDQDQFDPHPHSASDRNSKFWHNPRGYAYTQWQPNSNTIWSTYVTVDVLHPHGIQYTPRSLLFGIDDAGRWSRKLSKPYWAQAKVKYGDLFPTTDVFIIFGCSLGDTDRWWWNAIIQGLQQNQKADLILYWWRGADDGIQTPGDLRKKFSSAAGFPEDESVLALLTERARVVLYDDDTERTWLNTTPPAPNSWLSREAYRVEL